MLIGLTLALLTHVSIFYNLIIIYLDDCYKWYYLYRYFYWLLSYNNIGTKNKLKTIFNNNLKMKVVDDIMFIRSSKLGDCY